MVNQEPNNSSGTIQVGDGEIWLTRGGSSDRESIDRIGLAEAASTVSTVSNQLW